MGSTVETVPVITVDGPSGVGKGTITQMVAEKLGWCFFDSGVIYRLLALTAYQHQADLEDPTLLAQLAQNLDVQFSAGHLGESPRISLEGQDVTDKVREEEISQIASKVAAYPAVRAALFEKQRSFKTLPGLVTDGRDMGTTIFPEAVLKVFLTASTKERARRRYKQLKEKGMSVNLEHLQQEMVARDERDSQRAASPLVPAPGAIVIDTTSLTLMQVFERVMQEVRKHVPGVS